jgi:RHS repeat-associated protein
MCYEYQPYGTLDRNDQTVPNSFRWKGLLYDAESGLYYVRARYYAPEMRRFLSEDPIGLKGGINQYRFAGNDPINRADPTGMFWPDWSAVGQWFSDFFGGLDVFTHPAFSGLGSLFADLFGSGSDDQNTMTPALTIPGGDVAAMWRGAAQLAPIGYLMPSCDGVTICKSSLVQAVAGGNIGLGDFNAGVDRAGKPVGYCGLTNGIVGVYAGGIAYWTEPGGSTLTGSVGLNKYLGAGQIWSEGSFYPVGATVFGQLEAPKGLRSFLSVNLSETMPGCATP